MPEGVLFIVSAPSGAGKTSLVLELLKRINDPSFLDRVVTYTSRPARPNDVCGIDYHFINTNEFEQKIETNFFMEWSFHYGSYYGSAYSSLELLKSGKSLILILDPTTAYALAKKMTEAVVIWIDVKSIEVLIDRLILRNVESAAQMDNRIQFAQSEIDISFRDSFVHHRIMNDEFNDAVEKMKKFVLTQIFLKTKKS